MEVDGEQEMFETSHCVAADMDHLSCGSHIAGIGDLDRDIHILESGGIGIHVDLDGLEKYFYHPLGSNYDHSVL